MATGIVFISPVVYASHMNDVKMKAQLCRHCGYEFYARTDYPQRCKRCQKPYPLGFPPAEMVEQLGIGRKA